MTQDNQSVTGDFVWLRAGDLCLVLPREDVGDPSYSEFRPAPVGETCYFFQPGEDENQRYVAMSADMTLLDACPPDRFIVAPIRGSDVGWYWSELRVLIGVTLRLHTLPVTLVAPDTPVEAWVEHRGELAYMTRAERLLDYALVAGEVA